MLWNCGFFGKKFQQVKLVLLGKILSRICGIAFSKCVHCRIRFLSERISWFVKPQRNSERAQRTYSTSRRLSNSRQIGCSVSISSNESSPKKLGSNSTNVCVFYAIRNSFVRSPLIVSRSFAARSNSKRLAASRMSLSSFARKASSSSCVLNSGMPSSAPTRSV